MWCGYQRGYRGDIRVSTYRKRLVRYLDKRESHTVETHVVAVLARYDTIDNHTDTPHRHHMVLRGGGGGGVVVGVGYVAVATSYP